MSSVIPSPCLLTKANYDAGIVLISPGPPPAPPGPPPAPPPAGNSACCVFRASAGRFGTLAKYPKPHIRSRPVDTVAASVPRGDGPSGGRRGAQSRAWRRLGG